MTRDLSRLLRPRTVAVLGGGWAANVVAQCDRMGFQGAVWPVHPTRQEIAGRPCLPSLDALPAPPDAVFLGINREATLAAVPAMSAMGAGGAVAFAAGWAEAGAEDLQAALVRAAGDMPLLGPNCYGLVNYLDGVPLWPDQHGGKRVERGVAIVAQSSNIAITLTMQRRGLPLAYIACLGNAAQIGLAELGLALLADDRVTALGLVIEGVGDAAALAALVEDARAAGKGVVILKGGRTAAGAAAAQSHTAALTGTGAVSSAFLRQIGAGEVATPAELVETLKILHVHGPLDAPRVCAVACSGGEAGLVADLAAALVLDLAPLPPERAACLADVLGPRVALANPLDYHTYIWGDGPKTAKVFTIMADGYDASLFVIDPPRADRCETSSYDPALEAIHVAGARTGRPVFALATLPETLDEARAEAMMAQGTVPLLGIEAGLAALIAARTPPGPAGWRPAAPAAEGDLRLLPEGKAKALLAGAGIAVPRGVSAPDLSALREAARGLTPPLALKGQGFAHKTEAGAVRLNLRSLDGIVEMPGAEGYLVEEMVQGGVAELLVGIARDPVYGATLTLGAGGTLAELMEDVVARVLPLDRDEIRAALGDLRLWPLLDGYRGRPRADIPALVDAVLAMQDLMLGRPALNEIEVNPLIVCATGAVAVDAVIWERP